MKNDTSRILFFVFAIFLVNLVIANGDYFTTNGRWVVDGHGRRVKFTCVNWPSTLEPMVAEGLTKQPVDGISAKIRWLGYNCVRFTYPLYLITNVTYANVTVRQSFQRLGLDEDIPALETYNPHIIDLKLIDAFKAVVESQGKHNLMVILDNHITVPGWCCDNNDGNGFFGDKYFDPNVWLQGISEMAALFNGNPHVKAMSLRNELRGPRQNVTVWYNYMQQGAEAVHKNNPNVLTLLSGFSYDTDLSFIRQRAVNLTYSKKLVYEAHWYSFTDGTSWVNQSMNEVCGRITSSVMSRAGFLIGEGFPLFFTEFGLDQRGLSANDNRYFNCFLAIASRLDLDWAIWAITGTYYLRQGTRDSSESYGVLDDTWSQPRNLSIVRRLNAIQPPHIGPGLGVLPHHVIFHPATGLCVTHHLKLRPCPHAGSFIYTPQGTIAALEDCIEATVAGKPVTHGSCLNPFAKWTPISDSGYHLQTTAQDGASVCLEATSTGSIITSYCRCLSGDSTCDPTSQWFVIVDSTKF